jgi:hypothetical protein
MEVGGKEILTQINKAIKTKRFKPSSWNLEGGE